MRSGMRCIVGKLLRIDHITPSSCWLCSYPALFFSILEYRTQTWTEKQTAYKVIPLHYCTGATKLKRQHYQSIENQFNRNLLRWFKKISFLFSIICLRCQLNVSQLYIKWKKKFLGSTSLRPDPGKVDGIVKASSSSQCCFHTLISYSKLCIDCTMFAVCKFFFC